MYRAEYGKNGDLVTVAEYMNREGVERPSKGATKTFCPDCGEPTIPSGRRNARGFQAVRDEVTRPKYRNRFSHKPVDPSDTTSPVLTCPSSFRDDPRFKSENLRPLLESNQFHRNEKQRNEMAVTREGRKETLVELRRVLMQKLTGRDQIEVKDQAELDRARKSVISLAGLSEHPWVLPYAEVIFSAPFERTYKGRFGKKDRTGQVRFDTRGKQELKLTYADGETGVLVVPKEIIPSFRHKNGALVHMRNPQTNAELVIPVSRAYAAEAVKPFLRKQKEAGAVAPSTSNEQKAVTPVVSSANDNGGSASHSLRTSVVYSRNTAEQDPSAVTQANQVSDALFAQLFPEPATKSVTEAPNLPQRGKKRGHDGQLPLRFNQT